MAGGTSKRPGGVPLGERTRVPLHGSVVGLRRPPGPDPMAPIGETPAAARAARPTPTEAATYRQPSDDHRHVWVTTDGVRGPGLIVEWRQVDGEPWEGLVVHLRHLRDRWVTVREWLPAHEIEPV